MPVPEYRPAVVQMPRWAGVGLRHPATDGGLFGCRGRRWYPFQVNVCDCCDDPDPIPYEGRQLTIGPPATTAWPDEDPCR